MASSKTRQIVQSQLISKIDKFRGIRVQLGDHNGHMYPDSTNLSVVYYRMGNFVGEIINVEAPPILDLWVRIGKDIYDGVYQVLKVDGLQGNPTNTLFTGYAPSSRYTWGGVDPVFIAVRQFLPLRPTVNNQMVVTIGEGWLKTSTGWIYIAEQTVDLVSYIPHDADTSLLVSLTFDDTATLVVTAGLEVSPLLDLIGTPSPNVALVNMPDEPDGTVKTICACRIYKQIDATPQYAIQETLTNTDLIDLRFWEGGGGSGGGGGGHTIEDEGTPLTQRTNLNFVGAGVAATDDAGNDATVVTIPETDVAAKIHAATSKVTPVDNDEIGGADSAASYGLKKFLWSNIKATFKTYFDTLYAAATAIDDTVYGAGWDTDTTHAPSKNAVYDKINSLSNTIRTSVFTVSGVLATAPGNIRIYNKTGATVTVSQVFLSVNTAPTTQAIIVDVNKNGTTIFTNQAHRPQIAAAANTGNTTTIDVSTLDDGDYFSVDVDQVGTGTTGADLTVHIIYS